MSKGETESLKKELKLVDIFAISTGAMFSSGFFLLPGLAAAEAGPAAIIAYLIAAVLIMPAMLSQAELCTAMPRAGGSYFFLDRSLGPLVGTIGGFGTYLGLVLKTGFALLGIGVYLAIFLDIPVRPLALALVVVFAVLNIVGAKEATWLQRGLVAVLLGVLSTFILVGFGMVATGSAPAPAVSESMSPFLPNGVGGLISTVALVFVSYAGLTKVASVAEEVKNPERDIPLGMILSLVVTTIIYVLGVALVVMVVPATTLHADLAPLATATGLLFSGEIGKYAVAGMVIAAVAAFASTGNAGLMASSRYPLAMARDELVPKSLANVGSRGTPVPAILITSVLMAVAILFLSEGNIAKLASAFQLIVFALICLAVIVMRESRIEAYDPGFKSPFYPWIQILGLISSGVLLMAMNTLVLTLLTLSVLVGVVWYLAYARKRVTREGALLHWFAELGMKRFDGLESELRDIIREKGLRDDDNLNDVMNDAAVLDLSKSEASSFAIVVDQVVERITASIDCDEESLREQLHESVTPGVISAGMDVALPHARIDGLEKPILIAVRVASGLRLDGEGKSCVNALFFLVSSTEKPRQHLRMLARIAVLVEDTAFMSGWAEAKNAQALHEFLICGAEFKALRVDGDGPLGRFVGKCLPEMKFPKTIIPRFIRRRGRLLLPTKKVKLQAGDVLLLNGEPSAMNDWVDSQSEEASQNQ